MGAPADMTMKSLSGNWSLNKSLSSDPEPPLAFRGISWVVRKAVSKANIDVNLSLSKQDGSDKDVLVSVQTILGQQQKENLVLDWEPKEEKHALFGVQKTKVRWSKKSEIESAFLTEGLGEDEDVIEMLVESPGGGWQSHNVWLLKEVEGVKRQVRRYVLSKGGEELTGELVLDYRP